MSDCIEQEKTCGKWEALISRSIDGECSDDELALLRAHLTECPVCRETLRTFSLIDSAAIMQTARAKKWPSVPDVAHEHQERGPKHTASMAGVFKRTAKIVAAVAACAVFFIAGEAIGRKRTAEIYASHIGAVTVASPAMWTAGNVFDSARDDASNSERPFADSIKRYRMAVADELRKGDVDWNRARDLLEAAGELRTDIELLTLHLAYLDIESGRSRDEVADHWESLGGVTAQNKTGLNVF